MPSQPLTMVAAEGGHQPLKAYEGVEERFNPQRMAPRTMFPGEFIELLWAFKHPRYASIGIIQSELAEKVRKQLGIPSAGTIWAADFSAPRDYLIVVPANELPYSSITTAEWDEEQQRFLQRWDQLFMRGWRHAFAMLLGDGVLRNCRELDYWIGEDSAKIIPDRYRL